MRLVHDVRRVRRTILRLVRRESRMRRHDMRTVLRMSRLKPVVNRCPGARMPAVPLVATVVPGLTTIMVIPI